MTKKKAIEALADGHAVRHNLFVGREYIRKSSRIGWLEDEDGFTFSEADFWAHRMGEVWQEGWFIVKTK
jgi:hypothetical protein